MKFCLRVFVFASGLYLFSCWRLLGLFLLSGPLLRSACLLGLASALRVSLPACLPPPSSASAVCVLFISCLACVVSALRLVGCRAPCLPTFIIHHCQRATALLIFPTKQTSALFVF
eukprot:m.24440 g.24440  ORF g.24440 m.24440 type:complete len:116 (-) comp8688_c0_seq2:341-688(-)